MWSYGSHTGTTPPTSYKEKRLLPTSSLHYTPECTRAPLEAILARLGGEQAPIARACTLAVNGILMQMMHWYNPKTQLNEEVPAPMSDAQAIALLSGHPDSDEFIEEYRRWRATQPG